MASVNKLKTITTLAYASIIWAEKYNERKDYGTERDTNETRNSLAERGWLPNFSIPIYINDRMDMEVQEELERRQAEWDRLKKNVTSQDNPSNRAELHVFEVLNCEPVKASQPDGEKRLVTPDVLANAGFRRHRLYQAAMVQRYTAKPKDGIELPTDILINIPVHFAEYRDEADRIIQQQLENEAQLVGSKSMDDLEKLQITKKLFDSGLRKESEIRRLYSSSVAQKTFGICLADSNWPSLRIFQRFTIEPTDSNDRIPWGPVRGADLVKYNNRADAMWKKSKGIPLSKDELAMLPVTEEDVDTYFREKAKTVRGDGNAKKIMKKDNIDSAARAHRLKPYMAAMQCVLADSEALIRKQKEHPDLANAVFDMVENDKGAVADVIAVGLAADADLLAEVSQLIKEGKGSLIREALEKVKGQEVPTPDQATVENVATDNNNQVAPTTPTPDQATAENVTQPV